MTKEKSNILNKILDLDIRIIWVVIIFLMSFPLIFPFGLPIAVDQITRGYYDQMESLSPGSTVLVIMDVPPSAFADLGPQAVNTLEHLFEKETRIVMASFWKPETQTTYESSILPFVNQQNSEYGVEWVYFGFLEGKETAMSAFANDFLYIGRDAYGTPVNDIPLLNDVKSVDDVELVICISPGTGQVLMLVRQFSVPFEKSMLAGTLASVVPDLMPYYATGAVVGMMSGMPGAAQYELLLKKPGDALRGMDQISVAHLFIIVFALTTNSITIYQRMKGDRKR